MASCARCPRTSSFSNNRIPSLECISFLECFGYNVGSLVGGVQHVLDILDYYARPRYVPHSHSYIWLQ